MMTALLDQLQISALPYELIELIASFLEAKDLLKFRVTCKVADQATSLLLKQHIAGKLVAKVAAGPYHTLILLKNGTVWRYGASDEDQTKISPHYDYGASSRVARVPVKLPFQNVVDIWCGAKHSFFAFEDGTVQATGSNEWGKLGIGESYPSFSQASKMVRNVFKVKQIATSQYFSFFLQEDGKLFFSGLLNRDVGQIPDVIETSPQEVANCGDIKEVAVGDHHIVLLHQDGRVSVKGNNSFTPLGIGVQSGPSPLTQISDVNKIVHIATGRNHILLLKENGTVWTCGQNFYGELGLGNKQQSFKPQQIKELNNITEIFAGGWTSFALDKNGQLYGWGNNEYGQLSLNDQQNRLSPIAIPLKASKVTVNQSHTHFIQKKSVMGCGENKYGQLGQMKAWAPTLFASSLTDINKLSVLYDDIKVRMQNSKHHSM